MIKSEEQIFIQYKYGLALKKLLDANKKEAAKAASDERIDDSYNKISNSTSLRKATISNALSGLSEVKAYTLHQILTSLGKSYTQFGKIMDQLSDAEVLKYKQEKEDERKKRHSSNK